MTTHGQAPVIPPVRTTVPRVLLVDDNPAMRRALRGLLEDAGIQVIGEAANGLEGVTQAELLQPDVVLMDWRQGGPPPEQLCAAVRAAWRSA